MKKLSKKFILITLLFLFGFVSSNNVSAQSNEEMLTNNSIVANEIEYELTSYLDDHQFSTTAFKKLDPIEYGGAYIDSKGMLHFLVKDLTDEKFEFITNRLNSSTLDVYHNDSVLRSVSKNFIDEYITNNITIGNVDYSQKEIEKNIDQILASELVQKQLITEIYTDYSINGIVIAYDAKKINEELLETFLMDDLNIVGNFRFESVSRSAELQEHLSIYAGRMVAVGLSSCSTGFAIKSGSTRGFVTAGHCGTIGSSVSYSNTNVGTVTKRAYQSNIDAAFVSVNSNHTVIKQESTIPYTPVSYSEARTTLPVQGSTMLFSGQKTRKNVTLQSNNATFVASNMTWSKMLKYPETSVPGDSGGILLIGNQAVGVNRGGTQWNSPGLGGSYATPSSTVLNVLNLNN